MQCNLKRAKYRSLFFVMRTKVWFSHKPYKEVEFWSWFNIFEEENPWSLLVWGCDVCLTLRVYVCDLRAKYFWYMGTCIDITSSEHHTACEAEEL